MSIQEVIQKLEANLGNEYWVSPAQLVEAGIFGSYTAVNKALRKGLLPCIRITPHRTLIPRKSVIEHLHKSIEVTNEI